MEPVHCRPQRGPQQHHLQGVHQQLADLPDDAGDRDHQAERETGVPEQFPGNEPELEAAAERPVTMSRTRPLKRNKQFRRGVASVMAMMYLVLFSVLALGYYAQVTTSVAIADNDTTAVRSLRASESGMQFLKYQLAHLDISRSSSDPFHDTYLALYNNLHGTLNMNGQDVGLSSDGNTIYIPSNQTKYINIDKSDGTGLQFNGYITKVNNAKLRVV